MVLMRPYEIMVILDPTLDERTVAPSLETFLNVVRKDGGSVDKVDIWGKRRLAYEIAKHANLLWRPPQARDWKRFLRNNDGNRYRSCPLRRWQRSRRGCGEAGNGRSGRLVWPASSSYQRGTLAASWSSRARCCSWCSG